MLRVLTSTLFLATAAIAAPADPVPAPEAAAEPSQPNVRKLGDGKFAVGLVQFQQKSRHVSFPAEVNMTEGLLEYAIVHQNGKIHEALLHTKTNPFHVNIALKLLRYEASPELFQILDEDYKPTGKYPTVSEATKTAARVEILLSWTKDDGSKGKASLNDWISNTANEAPIPATPWVYGGSYFHNKVFQAEGTGDIAAIFTTNSALFNYPGTGHMDDEIWIPTPERIPPVGTAVTVTITPAGSH
jgi:hypothetical protein